MCCHDYSFFFHNQTQDFDKESIIISEEKESKGEMRSNLILQPGTASATNSANDEHDGVPPPLIGSPHFPVLGGG